MSDHKMIHQLLEKFYADQHKGAEERVSSGAPVGDIISALSSIRSAIPDYDEQTRLADWGPLACQALAEERQQFRRDNSDSAGMGAATFTELSDLILLLAREDR